MPLYVHFWIGPTLQQSAEDESEAAAIICPPLRRKSEQGHENKQMDIHVRLWEGDQVITRYLTSTFMGHATSADLLEHFHEACDSLNLRKLLQVSMDGPNVNWRFHRLLQEEQDAETGAGLLDIGSRGLHIVHGAFRTGTAATKWDVNGLLSALYYLFKDSPARREDYSKVSGSTVFPLEFCSARWVENVPVAERALEVSSAILPVFPNAYCD